MCPPMRTVPLVAVLTLVVVCSAHPAAAKGPDFCHKTTLAAVSACKSAAKSGAAVAVGNCANLADAAARKACVDQAKADAKDAQQECKDEKDARDTECAKLGPAPYDPVIVPANFTNSTTINNPFFPLVPGTTFVYKSTVTGEEDDFMVTHNTRVIDQVTVVEVHDVVMVGGEVTEDTLDWFAQDNAGNVWYFGENTHELTHGLISSIAGSFMAGVDDAKPGIIMEATSNVGDFYRQEFSLENAEDFAEVVSLNESVTVPAGMFDNCLKTEETSPIEPSALEHKFYKANVGNVLTVDEETGDRSELDHIVLPGP